MACKSCQERREWLARYRKETGSSAAKALLALYRKGKESGLEAGVPTEDRGMGDARSGYGDGRDGGTDLHADPGDQLPPVSVAGGDESTEGGSR